MVSVGMSVAVGKVVCSVCRAAEGDCWRIVVVLASCEGGAEVYRIVSSLYTPCSW